MQNSIEDLVEGVLNEMEIHGLRQSTIQQYRRGLFKPVIGYFLMNNDGVYSLETLESCRRKYKDSLDDQRIKQHHFQSMKRSLNYIREYAETGAVSFKPCVGLMKAEMLWRWRHILVPIWGTRALLQQCITYIFCRKDY